MRQKLAIGIALAWVSIAPFAALPSMAQSDNLSLSGTVTDNGKPEPGDRVFLYDKVLKKWLDPASTDNAGIYRFYGLPLRQFSIVVYKASDATTPRFKGNVDCSTQPAEANIKLSP